MENALSTFDVTGWLPDEWRLDEAEHAEIGRARVDKVYSGDFEGTGVAQMVAVQVADGDATYVALERLTGSLRGRQGTFAIGHSSTIASGEVVTAFLVIVPSSGTGELDGLAGDGWLRQDADGVHRLSLDYELPAVSA